MSNKEKDDDISKYENEDIIEDTKNKTKNYQPPSQQASYQPQSNDYDENIQNDIINNNSNYPISISNNLAPQDDTEADNTDNTDTTNNVQNPDKSINIVEHTLFIGSIALIVLLLYCVTKKFYSNKKNNDSNKKYDDLYAKTKTDTNSSRQNIKNKINNTALPQFSFKNKFGSKSSTRKSRELIPSILKVSPAPLASLSDEMINPKQSIDKDINVNESIIQAQSFNRNSLNYADFKTLSWHPINDYHYNANELSQSSSTDINVTENESYIDSNNKLDNAVDFYFSNKKMDLKRQDSSNSGYTDIPDNASSCGEPSLSRYIDNDALLKFESSRCKMNMHNHNIPLDCKNFDTYISTNASSSSYTSYRGKRTSCMGNRTSLSSSTVPSLSRYSIKNISSSIVSRNNRIYDSNMDYANNNDNNSAFSAHLKTKCSNPNLIIKSNSKKKHRNTIGANIPEERKDNNNINQNYPKVT